MKEAVIFSEREEVVLSQIKRKARREYLKIEMIVLQL